MVSPIPASDVQQTSTRALNHFNALTTACILLEHIQTLERLRDETQHRVEAKRQKLHFLQAFTPKRRLRDALSESIVTQQQMQDTPTSTRSSLCPSPRLRGLYDVHGPGCANQDSLQTTADFSPLSLGDLSIYGRDYEVVWEDDDDEALLCPSADEAVENSAEDASKEYCDQLNCFASPLRLVPSLSEITFEAQGFPPVPDFTNGLLIMFYQNLTEFLHQPSKHRTGTDPPLTARSPHQARKAKGSYVVDLLNATTLVSPGQGELCAGFYTIRD